MEINQICYLAKKGKGLVLCCHSLAHTLNFGFNELLKENRSSRAGNGRGASCLHEAEIRKQVWDEKLKQPAVVSMATSWSLAVKPEPSHSFPLSADPPSYRPDVGSGGDHAFVPLAVGHAAPVVVAHVALVGLLLASVQECLQRLSLAFGLAHHVTGTLRSEASPLLHGSSLGLGSLPQQSRILNELVPVHIVL